MRREKWWNLLKQAFDVGLWRVNHADCNIMAGAAFDKLGGIAMLADYGLVSLPDPQQASEAVRFE